MRAADTPGRVPFEYPNYSTWGPLRRAKLGREDARRGRVYWLVEPLDGHRIPRLVRSTHPQRAQALAHTPRLYPAALGEKWNDHCSLLRCYEQSTGFAKYVGVLRSISISLTETHRYWLSISFAG